MSNTYIVVAILSAPYAYLIGSLLLLRARQREALSQRHAMLRALPDMMFLLSCDGVYLDYHAPEPSDLLVPPSTFLGRRMQEILPPDLASRFEEAFAHASAEPILIEYALPLNGQVRHFEARLVRCGSNKILSIVRDVSARKMADDELADALEDRARIQGAAALGELAASVAHEVKQPLSAILVNAQACIRYLSDPSRNLARIHDALRDVVGETLRATHVVDRTRAMFQGHEPLVIEPFAIAQTIDAVLRSVRSRLQRAGIEVRTVLEPDLPPALGAAVQVQQVLFNLVSNAYDVLMQDDPRNRQITIAARREHGSLVLISVSDTGRGIDVSDIETVFNPQFTTKEHGMGIGLTISRSIAEAHGGKLWATRNDGRGSTFWLTIPALPHQPREGKHPVGGIDHERGVAADARSEGATATRPYASS
jgi:signal transduction histidine kinase